MVEALSVNRKQTGILKEDECTKETAGYVRIHMSERLECVQSRFGGDKITKMGSGLWAMGYGLWGYGNRHPHILSKRK